MAADELDLPRRFRPPRSNRLVIALSAVVGLVAVVAVFFAVLGWVRAVDAIRQIQTERRDSILRTCRDQNGRHDRTIAELDRLIRLLPADKRARAGAVRDSNVALIDALVPHQDCTALADDRVSEHP